MKNFFSKSRSRKYRCAPPEPPKIDLVVLEQTNLVELNELRLLSEKLLYRVQNLEKREKSLKRLTTSLRRELKALKASNEGDTSPSTRTRTTRTHSSESSSTAPPIPPAPRVIPPLNQPDFSGAADDLTLGEL